MDFFGGLVVDGLSVMERARSGRIAETRSESSWRIREGARQPRSHERDFSASAIRFIPKGQKGHSQKVLS